MGDKSVFGLHVFNAPGLGFDPQVHSADQKGFGLGDQGVASENKEGDPQLSAFPSFPDTVDFLHILVSAE